MLFEYSKNAVLAPGLVAFMADLIEFLDEDELKNLKINFTISNEQVFCSTSLEVLSPLYLEALIELAKRHNKPLIFWPVHYHYNDLLVAVHTIKFVGDQITVILTCETPHLSKSKLRRQIAAVRRKLFRESPFYLMGVDNIIFEMMTVGGTEIVDA